MGLLDNINRNMQSLLTDLDPRTLLNFGNGQSLQEAMQNRMQPGSLRPNLSNQQMIDAGLNIAGMAPVGMFIGRGAKTWDALKEAEALNMIKEGKTPREIWPKTGVYTESAEGLSKGNITDPTYWRQEIPDNAAKLDGTSWRNLSEGQEPGASYLDEVLNHKQLFDAYPDMRSRGMSYDEGTGLAALYNMDSQTYGMNPKAFQSGGFKIDGDSINRVTNKDSYNAAKSALLHEGSHDIQKAEGWARGGIPEQFRKPAGLLPDSKVLAQADALARWSKESGKPVESFMTGKPPKYLGDEWQTAAKGLAKRPDDLKRLNIELIQAQDPYGSYKRLSGETEARATQARMNMDMPTRLQNYPADSFDVPLEQQIVRFGEGPAMSTGRPRNALGKEDYLFHGTSEGAFRKIRESGLQPKNGKIYATNSQDYAKTYASRKGAPYGERILRVKNKGFVKDTSNKGGDYISSDLIKPEEIEVLEKGKWVPIQNYANEDIGIIPMKTGRPRNALGGIYPYAASGLLGSMFLLPNDAEAR